MPFESTSAKKKEDSRVFLMVVRSQGLEYILFVQFMNTQQTDMVWCVLFNNNSLQSRTQFGSWQYEKEMSFCTFN